MANLFTDTTQWTNLVETAYDREVAFSLRSTPFFRDVIDKRPARQAMPGDVVTLTIHGELAVASSPLTEDVDPDAVQPPAPTRVNVSLSEYGNATLSTLRLDKLAFSEPQAELANLVGYNMANSIDGAVKAVIDAGTNVALLNGGVLKTSGGAVNSIVATDVMKAASVATAVALLRRRLAVPKMGELYVSYVHPDVAYDIRAEAAGNTWVSPHQYVDTGEIYRGEIGTYAGAKFVESVRCTTANNTVPVKVYNSYFFGKEAVVEASAVEPHIVVGPQVDKLKRFFPLGWYALLGWALYRPEPLQIVKTTSSIQAL
jgi:N4-gp56 family major capsid protein